MSSTISVTETSFDQCDSQEHRLEIQHIRSLPIPRVLRVPVRQGVPLHQVHLQRGQQHSVPSPPQTTGPLHSPARNLNNHSQPSQGGHTLSHLQREELHHSLHHPLHDHLHDHLHHLPPDSRDTRGHLS